MPLVIAIILLATSWLAAPPCLAASGVRVQWQNEAPERPFADFEPFLVAEADRLHKGRMGAASMKRRLMRVLAIEDLWGARSQWTLVAATTSVKAGPEVQERWFALRSPLGAVRAALFLPNADKKLPVVVGIPRAGRSVEEFRALFGDPLLRRGYGVFIPEIVDHRRDEDFNVAFNALLVGRTLTGMRLVELACLVDLLETLPGVDQTRIAILAEGSGSLLAAFMSSLDARPLAYVVDSVIRRGLYYDYASDLMIPGIYEVLAAKRDMGHARLLEMADGYADMHPVIEWLGRIFSGHMPQRRPDALADMVERLFKTHKETAPDLPEEARKFELAMGAYRKGDVEAAIAQFKSIRAKGRGDLGVLQTLVELYGVQGSSEAEAMHLSIVDQSADKRQALLDLGAYYQRRGLLNKAQEQYEASARFDPHDDRADTAMARVDLTLGRAEVAEKRCLKVLAEKPYAWMTRVLLAEVYEKLGKPALAREQYALIVRLNPQAHLNLARLAEQQADWEAAESHYMALLATEPQNEEAHLALARLEERKERWSRAAEHYEEIVGKDPYAWQAWQGLAFCHFMQGRESHAFEALRKAWTINLGLLDPAFHALDARRNAFQEKAASILRPKNTGR